MVRARFWMVFAATACLCGGGLGSAASARPPEARVVLSALERARSAAAHDVQVLYREVRAGDRPSRVTLRVVVHSDGRLVQDVERITGAEATVATERWGGPGQAPVAQAPAWLQLLAGRSGREVAAAMGLDLERTSLAHAGAEIHAVLGAGPHEPLRPQLHVALASGRVRRTVETMPGSGAGPRVVTIALSGAAAPTGPAAAWPREVIVRWGVSGSLHLELAHISLDAAPAPEPGVR